MSCIFCELAKGEFVAESTHFFAVWDIDPIQEGHLLVIAKEHHMSLADLSEAERLDLLGFQEQLIATFEGQSAVKGITIATNNGKLMDAGTHFHSHLIPRYEHDDFWETVAPKQRSLRVNNLDFSKKREK